MDMTTDKFDNVISRMNFITVCISRHCSSSASQKLIGRSLYNAREITSDEIKSLIWTAIDLKTAHEGKSKPAEQEEKPKRLTLLMRDPQMDIKVPIIEAAFRLNANLKIIIDPLWDTQIFMTDTASYLTLYSDVIFCQGKYQSKIEWMRTGCPFVNLESNSVALCKVLTHLMTLQLRYGHLRGLTLAWVGPPSGLFNTYLCTAPYLGMNICYSCSQCREKMMSPFQLPEAKLICQETKTDIKECEDCQTALVNANVILSSKHDEPEMKVTLQMLEKASADWSFLCSFPRWRHEVDSEVVNHEKSLVWAAANNTQWMIMALVLRLLEDYQHRIEYPNFENKAAKTSD